MSKFGEAFKAARAGGGKTFMFNGKKYTTDRADDKPAAGGRKINKSDLAMANANSDPIGALARIKDGGGNSRDAEAGMTRGMPAPIENAKAAAPKTTVSRYKPEESTDMAGTMTDTFKKGGRVTGYKGYGKSKKV